MRKAKVFVADRAVGELHEIEIGKKYRFEYYEDYDGEPVSITMPSSKKVYEYDTFPPFFDGLLPEGYQLEALLRTAKIDRNDMFKQLVAVGDDMIGNVSIQEINQNNNTLSI
jgi:serine/threonine-protein kinase HipA